MSNKKKTEDDKERNRILKQHSALTTFKIESKKYFNIDAERAIFSILAITQNELQKLFKEECNSYLSILVKSDKEKEKILSNIYNKDIAYEIDYSKFNVEEIPKMETDIIKKKIEAANSKVIEEEKRIQYLKDIEGIDIKKITNANKLKITYTYDELANFFNNLKDVCQTQALIKYGRTKVIDFTSFANWMRVNPKRLKVNLAEASNIQLSFNYIDRKNLKVESVSNLMNVSFYKNEKSKQTWMEYQIPDEILKFLLLPKIYSLAKEEIIYRLEGKYSIRLYSFLKDHVLKGDVTITKEECKEFLKLPASYLTSRQHFLGRVLIPTLADINAKTSLDVTYELIPEYNFREIKFYIKQKQELKDVDKEIQDKVIYSFDEMVNISDEIKKGIERAKRNVYVSRSWNKRVDNKLEKIIKEQGEEFTLEILSDLYNNLKENIKTTLVQYINGIIKNKKIIKTYKKTKDRKISEKELQFVSSDNIEETKKENDEKELQFVSSNKKEDDQKETELQFVSSEESQDNLYDKCRQENRTRLHEKYLVSREEYEEEKKRYKEAQTPEKIINIILSKLFIIREED